jgi:hypothetical protein
MSPANHFRIGHRPDIRSAHKMSASADKSSPLRAESRRLIADSSAFNCQRAERTILIVRAGR